MALAGRLQAQTGLFSLTSLIHASLTLLISAKNDYSSRTRIAIFKVRLIWLLKSFRRPTVELKCKSAQVNIFRLVRGSCGLSTRGRGLLTYIGRMDRATWLALTA